MRIINEDIINYNSSEFSWESVEDICDIIKNKINKKYPKYKVDLDDQAYSDDKIQVNIILYRNNKEVVSDYFKFTRRSTYAGKNEFKRHLNDSIEEFVDKLI